jgi:hypothetical protein
MRASRPLRLLALLFALSGIGRLPDRPVGDRAEVARVTTTQPRRAPSTPRAIATATLAPVSRVRPSVTRVASRTPRDPRSRFVSRLYLRNRALLL